MSTLFYMGCIPLRLLFVCLAYCHKSLPKPFFTLFTVMTAVIGIGFWMIYLNGWRKTGPETFGKPICWNDLRPFHGTMYLLFSLCSLSEAGRKYAWMFLALDVFVGFVASIQHYTKTGH